MRGARVGSSVDDTAETKSAKQDWDCSGETLLRRYLGGQRAPAARVWSAYATARWSAETLVRRPFGFPLRRTPIAVTYVGNVVQKAALSHREGR